MNGDGIVIGTSIAPNERVGIQREAITSWLNAGFLVQSFNAPDEIDRLTDGFDGVEFVSMERSGQGISGRRVIYISDMLFQLRAGGSPVCGIINSDILLTASNNFRRFVGTQADGSLLYGSRLDVASWDDRNGRLDPYGFDYFFFDRDLIPKFGETQFCLGMPFWDHWLPLASLLSGQSVRKLVSPIARHITHPTSRDDSFFAFNTYYVKVLLELTGRISAKGHDGCNGKRHREFKAFADQLGSYQLEALIQNTEGELARAEDEKLQMESLATLAKTYDQVTQSVVLFLDRNSKRINFE